MFACTTMNGMAMTTGPTDTCKTPTPGGPVPMPYPNIAMLMTANPSTADSKVLVLGMPVLNAKSEIPLTNGDNPGVVGGVVSNMVMGACKFKSSSMKVSYNGKAAVHLTCQTGHNGSGNPNAMGAVTVPSQTMLDVS